MTPFTLAALKLELTENPMELGYVENNDVTLAVINNPIPSITKPRSIPRADLLKWAAKNGVLLALKNASNTESPVQGVAFAALLMLQGSVDMFDMTDADNVAMVDALTAASVITIDQKASLLELATMPASRAEQIFGRLVTLVEIEQARVSENE